MELGDRVMTRTVKKSFLVGCFVGLVGTQPTPAQNSNRGAVNDGLRLTLLLDLSASTSELLDISQAVGVDLAERLDEERDLGCVVAFSNKVQVVQDFTADRARLKSSILALESTRTPTSLFNAIYLAFRKDFEDGRRRVIVVVSDGDDTSSVIKADHLRSAAGKSEAALYAILLGRGRKTGLVRELADTTGGQTFQPRKIQDVKAACQHIADAMDRGKIR